MLCMLIEQLRAAASMRVAPSACAETLSEGSPVVPVCRDARAIEDAGAARIEQLRAASRVRASFNSDTREGRACAGSTRVARRASPAPERAPGSA